MALPTILCLKSVHNNKYLRFRHEDGQSNGLLQFAAATAMDPYAQFEVENSKIYKGLVHLKCRYNNKYLVRLSPYQYWMRPSAYEPIEDQTSWTCTLFKPTIIEDLGNSSKKIRLLHVQLGHYANINITAPAPYTNCLFADSKDPNKSSLDVFVAVDWDAMFKLPNKVAFKGDNGKFLGANPISGQPGLQFAYDNPRDPKVQQETFLSPDGTIYLKSTHYGKFWRVVNTGNWNWIAVDANDPRGSKDNYTSMFRLSVVDINVIALLNMKDHQFCKRLTAENRTSYLSANTKAIDEWARLQVVDLDGPSK